jgi:hypothetical protein
MLFLKNIELLNTISYWLDKNRKAVSRFVIILAVLSVSFFLAPRIALGQRYPTILFFLLLAVGFFIIVMRWPIFGLVLVMVEDVCTFHGGA